MADMDLDDLDGPTQAPTRTSRFAPKSSKPKPLLPKPELNPEPSSSEPPPPEAQNSDSIPSQMKKKKEELDSEAPLVDSVTAANNMEFQPNHTVKLDQELVAKPMDEDQIEDVVVREIDVFFTPSIDNNTQLYVLQYPLRAYWRPYELDERCEEVRVKPLSAQVEVDLSIDVDSKNYDGDFVLREKMTNQTLSSQWKLPLETGYAVGVLLDNKLHLNPIRAVVQLRPSMDHLKSGGSKKKNNDTTIVEATIKSEELEGKTSVGPSKKQNKPPGNLGEQNKDIEESWVPLKYHGSNSNFSTRYLRKMATEDSSPIPFMMSPCDYVNSLCPSAVKEDITAKGPSKRYLLSIPLEERFKTLLREGPPVHRFDSLKHLAPDGSIEDLLRVLQKHAQLVQGLWVPKSSLLYEGGRGLDVLARDYILLLFTRNPVVSYEQVNVSGALSKAMKGVLNILAVERPSFRNWKFIEPQDTAFIKRHPNIVKEQEQAWERVDTQITGSIFGGGKTGPGRPGKNSSKGEGQSSNGGLSRTLMSNETREALPKALQKIFITRPVCSFKEICKCLRVMALSESNRVKGLPREALAAAKAVDAPQEQLLDIIGQVAMNIHGVYVPKSSPEHPEFDEFRKVVIDLLIAEGPNAKLKKASIVEAAKMQLKRDVPLNEYQKILNELCLYQGSAWVLKSGEKL